MAETGHNKGNIPYHLIFIFLALSIGIWAAGYAFYLHQKEDIKRESYNNILAIAELKANQISNWRKERLGDAMLVMENPFVAEHAAVFLRNPGAAGTERQLLQWLRTLYEHFQYHCIFLLDASAEMRLSVPKEGEVVGAHVKTFALEAMKQRKAILSDIHRGESGKDIHIDLFAPILLRQGDDIHSVGVVLMRISPDKFLYPLIQTWPTPSPTAETILVRREGNEVVFLNELRHKKDTALSLRVPVEKTLMPAVRAVMGNEGIVEGIDYRGVPVFAALLPIPDSPWFMVSKIDEEEVYERIERRAWFVGIISVLMIVATGLSIGFIWRHQRAGYYKKQYELECERRLYARRYEYLTKHANDIILLTERDGKIIDMNERAVDAYGYEPEEMLRLNLRDLQLSEARELMDGHLKEIEACNGMIFESFHQKKDGTIFPVEASSRIIDIDGKQYFQSIIRDITERKQTEEELQKYRQQLEKMVKERTAQLEATNKELEAFSYSISHDLRAPLRAIEGFTEILLGQYVTKLDDEGKRIGSVIAGSTKKMNRLIDEILLLSRLGRKEMQYLPIDMKSMANGAYLELADTGKRQRIDFQLGDLHDASGDSVLIKQVWMNLISNAIKFTSNREQPVISITSKEEGDKVVYCVKDNGAGFDMNYKDKLFGVFQRLHSEKEFAGTGVGLAIVQRIVHRHGGGVWAEGKVNKGAEFCFGLPRKTGNRQ